MTTFWTTAELLRLGKSPGDIRRAATGRVIEPVRKGHWSTPGADTDVARAVRVGGVATATTAARALGLWTPPDPGAPTARPVDGVVLRRGHRPPDRLHLAVPRSSARLRDPEDPSRPLGHRSDVVVHWVQPGLLTGSGRTRMVDPLLMLAHTFAVQPPERALAVVKSALRLRHLRVRDLPTLAAMLPAHLRPLLVQASPAADSGLETIARTLLRARGLRVDALVRIDGVGEVDLLVEGRLLLELDGREFHDDHDAFERDRTRDVEAARRRYRVLRLTWYQVLFRWPWAEAAIFAALAQ